MGFLTKVLGLINKAKSKLGDSENENLLSTGINTLKSVAKTKIITFVIPLLFPIIIVFIFAATFADDVGLMQMVDPNMKGVNSSNVGTVIYDEAKLEEYFLASENAYETGNTPSVDLASTDYGSVDAFNKHIKDTVCEAGYGTRQGVVAAGMSLVGDYILATGTRLRYDQGGRQYYDGGNNEGIINDNFYLDCSSFSWWALYNGGFNIPCWPYTGTQHDWSDSHGYSKTPGPGVGQAGDFLVSYGHIILIVGTYEDGYYCAEEAGWGVGAKISKRSYGGLGAYVVIDMEEYYSNPANIRDNGGYCPIGTPSSSDSGSNDSTPSQPSGDKKYDAEFTLKSYSHPGGETLQYWINVPAGATNQMPLVTFLHGDGEVGNPGAVSNLAQPTYMRNSTKFISIIPITNRYSWVDGALPQTLKGLIDMVAKNYDSNMKKIYITGFSRGATGVWNMVNSYPQYFSAAIPMSNCTYSSEIVPQNFIHTKILATSGGSGGDYCDCMDAFVEQINQAGGSARKITYENESHGSVSWAMDYDYLFNWLLSN